jgi:hypothetical protein
VTNCDFTNLTEGINIANTTTPLTIVKIQTSNLNLVSNGITINTPINTSYDFAPSVSSCTFNYKVNGTSISSGTACKFLNMPEPANVNNCSFSGCRLGSLYENLAAIELQNATVSLSGSTITDFKVGISGEKEVNNNISLSNMAEINGCETGINMVGGTTSRFATVPYGSVSMTCFKLVDNITGIKGTDVRLGIDVRNKFQTLATSTNSLLFDICYSTNTSANSSNIQASNNFWTGGFSKIKFKLIVGACTTGGRRKLEQCSGSEMILAPRFCTDQIANCCNKSTIVYDGTGTTTTGIGIVCLMSNNSNKQASANTRTAEETDVQLANPVSTGHKTGSFIYPNPAKETVNLNLENGNYQLRVSNTIGQVIFEQNTEGVLSVNVSTWTNGIYLFEVTDKATNKQQRSKIVVQH